MLWFFLSFGIISCTLRQLYLQGKRLSLAGLAQPIYSLGYGPDNRRTMARMPTGAIDSSMFQSVQIGSGAHRQVLECPSPGLGCRGTNLTTRSMQYQSHVCRLGAKRDNFDFTLQVGSWVGSRRDLEGSGARQVRWRSGGTFLVRQNITQQNRVTHIAKHSVGNTGWTR